MAESIECGEGVLIAPTAVIHPSRRVNRFIIGEHSEIYDQVVIRFVGGSSGVACRLAKSASGLDREFLLLCL